MENLQLVDRSFAEEETSIGTSLGFGIHATETKKALMRYGVQFSDSAPIVLHQGPSHLAEKVPGKINILYTAWEAPDLPADYIVGASKMDLIVVTSKFVKVAFSKVLRHIPIEICPLGVDINTFSFVKRKYELPFRFLWVGAPNTRKGWDLIRQAWNEFAYDQNFLLIMKTTGGNVEDGVHREGNVIVDNRKLDRTQLAHVYHFAHCFLFPSYAEGFGLPLAEAMSTGLPCIFTNWSGMVDFANKKNAYPLKYSLGSVDYGVQTYGAVASIKDLVSTMRQVSNSYNRAVVKAKEARRTIERNYSWDDTGRILKNIIQEFVRWHS